MGARPAGLVYGGGAAPWCMVLLALAIGALVAGSSARTLPTIVHDNEGQAPRRTLLTNDSVETSSAEDELWRSLAPKLMDMELLIPESTRDAALSYIGQLDRAQAFAAKLVRGTGVKVVAVGGSTTVGAGAYRGNAYDKRFVAWLQETFPIGAAAPSPSQASPSVLEVAKASGATSPSTAASPSTPATPASSPAAGPSPGGLAAQSFDESLSSGPTPAASWGEGSTGAPAQAPAPGASATGTGALTPAPSSSWVQLTSVDETALAADDGPPVDSLSTPDSFDQTQTVTPPPPPSPTVDLDPLLEVGRAAFPPPPPFNPQPPPPTSVSLVTPPPPTVAAASSPLVDGAAISSSASTESASDAEETGDASALADEEAVAAVAPDSLSSTLSDDPTSEMAGATTGANTTAPTVSSPSPPLGQHTLVTNALGSTTSALFSACAERVIDTTGDMYVVEFAINDPASEALDGPTRQAFERLLRYLLQLPQSPLVVVLAQYSWVPAKHMFQYSSEPEMRLIAEMYDVPVVSMRNAIWPHLDLVEGFYVNSTVSAEVRGNDTAAEWNQFISTGVINPKEYVYLYYDTVHPADLTGHRVMSDLLVELVRRAVKRIADDEPEWFTSGLESPTLVALPAPMLMDDYSSSLQTCVAQDEFLDLVKARSGFLWQAAVPTADSTNKQKWSLQASTPGSFVRFSLSTRLDGFADGDVPADAPHVDLQLAVVRSPSDYGIVTVTCLSGCTCNTTEIDGKWSYTVTQTTLYPVEVTQATNCTVAMELSASTANGGTAFVLRGAAVSPHAAVLFSRPDNQGDFIAIDVND